MWLWNSPSSPGACHATAMLSRLQPKLEALRRMAVLGDEMEAAVGTRAVSQAPATTRTALSPPLGALRDQPLPPTGGRAGERGGP